MCVIHHQDGTIKPEFRGENCNQQLLDFAPDGSVIYFHNLAYDIRMFASFGISRSIIKGNKTLRAIIKYCLKTITFKYSLPMISCKSSQFPKMFSIRNILLLSKEIQSIHTHITAKIVL